MFHCQIDPSIRYAPLVRSGFPILEEPSVQDAISYHGIYGELFKTIANLTDNQIYRDILGMQV